MRNPSPSNPEEVMVIRKLNDHITTLSVPFWRVGLLRIGGRGTLVRLKSGAVAVFSPVALTPEVKETVHMNGELKYIIAPDTDHHIFLGPWHEAYPDAKVIAPEGLLEKRKKQKNEEVPFSTIFKAGNKESMKVDAEFDAEFDSEYFPSHPHKEMVFLHKPSRTLIEADLMFNLPATEQFSKSGEAATQGFLTRFFIKGNNTQGAALGQKRFVWYALSVKDRAAWNASLQKINGWDFETIVPCHGDVIEGDGKAIFQKVFGWHFDGPGKAGKKST